MKTKKPDNESKNDRPVPEPREHREGVQSLPEIDFATLDLSVEKVEERISPGETNVFDK